VEATAEKPGIFISYARSDSAALAEELVAGLELAGFRPFLDRHDIAASEDWEARLGALILGADTVVFILSPAAVRSNRCTWEMERAAELGKRLIPVEGAPVPEVDVPERLRASITSSSAKASLSLGRCANWQRRYGRMSNGSGNIHV
jgi:hypothetical protein